MKRVAITAHKQANLIDDLPDFEEPIPADAVRGRTLVSLISSGTELNHAFLSSGPFPIGVGYACVFKVTEIGEDVRKVKVGDWVFSSGGHVEVQQAPEDAVVVLPEGLKPETAVFARLMGVSMSTLNTASAHPPAKVLVTGLGLVGNLAAQIFHRCGYAVTASDPDEARCRLVRELGIPDVRTRLGEEAGDLKDSIALHLECAGHESAVLDGCRLMRRKGECVLIGVPWSPKADLQSFEILHAVFHNYVCLRSGWEWEIPRQPESFKIHSIIENYRAAIRWLHEGSIVVDALGSCHSPAGCQGLYCRLLEHTLETPAAVLDWRLL